MEKWNRLRRGEEGEEWFFVIHTSFAFLSLTHAARQRQDINSQISSAHVAHCISRCTIRHGDICTNRHICKSRREMHSTVLAVHPQAVAQANHLSGEQSHHDHHDYHHDCHGRVHGCGLPPYGRGGIQDSAEDLWRSPLPHRNPAHHQRK